MFQGVKIRKKYTIEGMLQIVWERPDIHTDYIAAFRGLYVSDFFTVPTTAKSTVNWAELFNKLYNKESTGYWKGYQNGVAIEITFGKFTQSDQHYFRFNFAE